MAVPTYPHLSPSGEDPRVHQILAIGNHQDTKGTKFTKECFYFRRDLCDLRGFVVSPSPTLTSPAPEPGIQTAGWRFVLLPWTPGSMPGGIEGGCPTPC